VFVVLEGDFEGDCGFDDGDFEAFEGDPFAGGSELSPPSSFTLFTSLPLDDDMV
jgi:hypothetical protein